MYETQFLGNSQSTSRALSGRFPILPEAPLCSGFGQYHTDNPASPNPRPYQGITFDDILQMVSCPESVPKDMALWVLFTILLTRNAEEQRKTGIYHALWGDIDNPTELEAIKGVLANLVCFYIIYSSRGATPEPYRDEDGKIKGGKRWRVIIPLAKPANTNEWKRLEEILNDKFQNAGIIPDRKSECCNQICFLPNRGSYYKYHIENLPLLNWPKALAKEIRDKQHQEEQKQADLAAQNERSRQKAAERMQTGETSPINAYNACYPLEQCLETYGYKRIGYKWLSPNSESGNPGVTIKNNRWLSSHSSDADIGRPGKNGGNSGDAFDLFVYFEHGGDYKAATRAAGNLFMINGKTLTKVNQQNYAKKNSAAIEFNHAGNRGNTVATHETDTSADPTHPLIPDTVDKDTATNPDPQNYPDLSTPLTPFSLPHQSSKGRPLSTVENLAHVLDAYGISVHYDEILKQTFITFPDHQRNRTDMSENGRIQQLRSLLALNGVSEATAEKLPAILMNHSINPIVDFITGAAWDSINRLDSLFDTITVNEGDSEYRNMILFRWFIQCVAAADGGERSPIKTKIPMYELMLVLQGGQGKLKTSWFRALLPPGHSHYIQDGVHLDISDKDSVKEAVSSWITELGELDSTFRKSDVSRLKAFLSKRKDTIRMPYDRVASEFRRRTSFCASVNDYRFLIDETGNRRYGALAILGTDPNHSINMQQLWAEVWQLYLSGERWWFSAEEALQVEERNAGHMQINPVEDAIRSYFDLELIDEGDFLTCTDIAKECSIQPTKSNINAVSTLLKRLGFKRFRIRGWNGFRLKRSLNIQEN
ncbi:MAG: VapE domain-containing protein [Methylococcaceae bacterium]